MNVFLRPVEFEMDHDTYLKILIRHQEDLGLPYDFPIKLSFLASPLAYGKALLAFDEDDFEVVGAAGFVYGTGADEFQDRSRCQVEIAFLRKDVRSGTSFVRGLRALLDLMRGGTEGAEVRDVQFWLTGEQSRTRLFAKLLALPGAEATPIDGMLRCVVPYGSLYAYARRFEARLQPLIQRDAKS